MHFHSSVLDRLCMVWERPTLRGVAGAKDERRGPKGGLCGLTVPVDRRVGLIVKILKCCQGINNGMDANKLTGVRSVNWTR